MQARVIVRLKPEVPDAPGQVVAERLVEMGFGEVKTARIGKFIELELEAADRQAIGERVRQMCDQLLTNALIEDYEIQSVE